MTTLGIQAGELVKLIDAEKDNKEPLVLLEKREPGKGKQWRIDIWRLSIRMAPGDKRGMPFRPRAGDLNRYLKTFKNAEGPDPSSYIVIKRGPQNPRFATEKTKDFPPTVELVVDSQTALGKVFEYHTSYYEKTYNTLKAAGTLPKNVSMWDVIQRNYSTDPTVPEEKRGKERPSPVIRLELDFNVYPPDHKIKDLIGRPRTEVYDFDTATVDGGKIKFDLATVNGQLLNKENAHEFLTQNSHIIDMTVDFSQMTKSTFGFSASKTIMRMIVKHVPKPARDSNTEVDSEGLDAAKLLQAEKAAARQVAKPADIPAPASTNAPGSSSTSTNIPATGTSTPTTAGIPTTGAASTTPSLPVTGIPVITNPSTSTEVSKETIDAFLSKMK